MAIAKSTGNIQALFDLNKDRIGEQVCILSNTIFEPRTVIAGDTLYAQAIARAPASKVIEGSLARDGDIVLTRIDVAANEADQFRMSRDEARRVRDFLIWELDDH